MRVVVSGEKVTDRQTRVLLRTTPLGTACQAAPVQDWTVKSLTPHCDQVMAGVGSLGAFQASWTVKTATSSTVLLPAKAISTQSGYALPVASCQTPPAPYGVPRRSPLVAPTPDSRRRSSKRPWPCRPRPRRRR